jgi:hypothetical protein
LRPVKGSAGASGTEGIGNAAHARWTARVDRNEVFLEHTKSICPVSERVVDGEVNVRKQPGHPVQAPPGPRAVRGPAYSDAELCMAQPRFKKPGTPPLDRCHPRRRRHPDRDGHTRLDGFRMNIEARRLLDRVGIDSFKTV